MENSIFVLIGKSASGKDTLANSLCEDSDLNLSMCISTTSRPIRENEVQGVHYNFVTQEQFLTKIKNEEVLEYRKYITNFNNVPDVWYYGTETSSVKDRTVLVLDLVGLITLKKMLPEYKITAIYLDCSDEVRKQRAQQRGSFCEAEWERRLQDDSVVFNLSLIREHCNYILDSSCPNDVLLYNVKRILSSKI